MTVSLRYRLDAQSSYVRGGPIVVGFKLENLSSFDMWILMWYTPLEGIKGKIFEVKCDGSDIPYEGRMVKRGNPEREDYVFLPAGGSVGTEFDLSQVYSVPECRECRLKFKGRIHHVVVDGQQFPQTADKHMSVDIPGNEVSFRITNQ